MCDLTFWFHKENIKIIKNVLKNNCFPSKMVDQHVYKRINFLKHNSETNRANNHSPQEIVSYISLPYITGHSENISYFLKKFGVKVVYKLPKKLNSLIKNGKYLLTGRPM